MDIISGAALYRLANGLTLCRLLATPIVIILLVEAQQNIIYKKSALLMLILMQFSDVADGFIARCAKRRTKAPNPFGRIMDPVADKLYIDSTYVALSVLFGFPIWVTIIVVFRDIILMFGWLIRKFLLKIDVMNPNFLGKTADTLQAFLIFAFLLDIPSNLLIIWIVIMITFTIISGVIYSLQGLGKIQ